MIKHIEIVNAWNKVLRGYLTIPVNFHGLIVVMFHGFTGNKTEHGGLFRDFSRLLEENNIASLRMDFSGNGESDGNFNEFTFETLFSDANLILNYAKNLPNVKKVCLNGFSMGGAVSSYIAARRQNEIDRLLLWSPAGNIVDLIKNIYEKSPKLENENADYPNFEISKALYQSVSNYKLYENLNNYKKEVLIFHGGNDQAVNFKYGERYKELFPNSKLIIIQSAGHGYDKREEKKELFEKSLMFVKGLKI